MMEDHEFCDSCPGCRPAMMTTEGRRIADDDPMMVIVNRLWDNETTYAQRRAFIEVTLKNSRKPHDLRLFQEVATMMQEALEN